MKSLRLLPAIAALSCACFIAPAWSGQAGPQTENHQGLAALPLRVGSSIHFREIGPAVTGGRVTAVVGVEGNANLYYVGTADGGIFRTDNGGTTWKALFQHQKVASIGAIAIDPRNPSVIWVGTGEANVRNDVSFGDGVYKSTDGGRHWKRVGLAHTFQISRIVVNPHNPNIVLVAAMGSPWANNPQRGVYRTTDGGKKWTKVLYRGPGVGISDMAIDPANPQIVYAATYQYRRKPWTYSGGGSADAIYKSIDGGATWSRLKGHGLPTKPVARIGLAVAASSPNVVYAVIGSNQGVLWRSSDYGENWALVSKNQEVDSRPFYFSHIEVDPKRPNHVFAISNNLLVSSDGGHNFHTIASKIHVDYHTMWIDPNGSGRIIDGNDGGIAISRDNGKTWKFIDNFPIGQFYHVALGRGIRYQVCGGLQDNSSWCGPSWSKDPSGILNRMWYALNGGDGVYAIPASDNPNLIYNSTQNGVYQIFDRATEQSRDIEPYPRDFTGKGVASLPYRFAWEAAFAVSPDNPKVLYAGGNVVFKSVDRGRTWKVISPDLTRNDKAKQGSSGGPVIKDNSGAEAYDAILTISVASSNPNVIWVGTDDGEVQVTRNGGKTWTNVSSNLSGLAPWGRIESIDVSPTNPGNVLIAVDRHFSGDFRPYLYRSSNYGATWTSVSGNLPKDVYAHVIRRDLHNPDLYYAGLENGLYVSWDRGHHWYLFGLGLPDASVYDIALDARDNDLVVATHGRSLWILDDLTPFQDFNPKVAREPLTLFHPEAALRYWPWSNVEDLGNGTFYGENPAYGATFNYYLTKSFGSPGELIITNASGKVVRTIKGLHKGKAETMTPKLGVTKSSESQNSTEKLDTHGKSLGSSNKKEVPWVPTQAGLHRIHWDLRAQGPVRWDTPLKFQRGPRAGAMLPPGSYTATLKIGGQTASQTFTVINDPDSHGKLAAMQQQYKISEEVLHEFSQLDVALNRLHAIDIQAKALRDATKGTAEEKSVDDAVKALEQGTKSVKLEITSNAGAEESTLRVPDKVREHLGMLAYLLQGSDTAPAAPKLAVKVIYDREYSEVIADYNHFLNTEVSTFNQAMANLHLTGVVPGKDLVP
jgi:photosystem II stability/assembly factor-like uncharacterized protein